VPSGQLSEQLTGRGLDVSERTVRLYLAQMSAEGLTEPVGRRGHRLTESGRAELKAATVFDRVGLLSAKIDEMTYRMSFDLATRRGTVMVNTSIAPLEALAAGAERICEVFARGYAMGQLLTLLGPGERVGEIVVPEGRVGFCTVCSVTINGVLLKNGIPTRSRFGGLLELIGGRATRFVELINYDGTTIDPLEVFIRSGMTDYLGAISTGNGRVGAGFREIPAESREIVVLLAERLQRVGLGAVLEIGWSGQPLFGIPVGQGHAGVVVVGGLNPISILEEMGHRVESRALSGLLDFSRLFHYSELSDRLAELSP
jgi:hypothetical protein